MRKKAPSEAVLFPHARQRVLATLLLHPKKEWYLSELARLLKSAPAHLHRELALLTDAGILRRRVEGRQVYYSPDPQCPYLPELTGLVRKTMGFDIVLAKALKSLGSNIRCAFVYGSIAKGEEKSGSDIDLMVVGDVTISDLLPALTRAERELGRPVNPTVYPQKELVKKLGEGNHFVRAVLADPAKTFIVGNRNDLEKAANGRADKSAQDHQGRTRRTSRRRRG
jgi:predicted nucleotidyltransferase